MSNLAYRSGVSCQRQLSRPKGDKTQRNWIALHCDNGTFDMRVIDWHDSQPHMVGGEGGFYGNGGLWAGIQDLQLTRHVYWCITFGMFNALKRAGMFKALEDGLIEMPVRIDKKGRRWRSGKFNAGQRVTEIDLVVGKSKIKFLDLANYSMMPEDFGHSMTQLDIEQVTMCLTGYLSLCDYLCCCVNKTTAAQVGWRMFRHACQPSILSVTDDCDVRCIERRGYFPGRNEVYQLGQIEGTTYALDIKSCYASVCLESELPCHCVAKYPKGLPVDHVEPNSKTHFIADVVIKTESADYPVRFHNDVIYPIGEYATTLCWPELKHALHHCRVKLIRTACEYVTDMVFKEYAEWYQIARNVVKWDERKKYSLAIKSMFNSSLGYTARRKYDWLPWEHDMGYRWWMGSTVAPDETKSSVSAHILDYDSEWLRIGGEPRDAQPFLHATICSHARIKLMNICDIAGAGNVVYVDTDGLLVTQAGRDKLYASYHVKEDAFGKLVQRFSGFNAYVNGLKNYRVGDNAVCAGLPKTRRSQFSDSIVLKVPNGIADTKGKVAPFRMRLNAEWLKKGKYVNELY